MMSNKTKIISYVILFIIMMSVLVTSTYKILSNSVKNLIIQNVNEIAEHDMLNIQSYISGRLEDINIILREIDIENVKDLKSLQSKMNVKVTAERFEKMYMIDEDGNLYGDNYSVLPEKKNPFLDYFVDENGVQFARRYDDIDEYGKPKKEYLLYGRNMSDSPLVIDGITFVAVVALNDISEIQGRMRITGFGGKSYSSVINRDGYYIVNINRKSGLDIIPNFFDILDDSTLENSITLLDIREEIRNRNKVEFSIIDGNGTKKYISVKPIQDTNWCFVNSIDTSVFTSQTYVFMVIAMGTLFALIMIIVVGLIVFHHTQKKLKKIYATSVEGVFNRKYYNDKIEKKRIMSFVMFDLDHLKYINDGYGHLAGDMAIATTAEILHKHIGSMGYVIRYGGDEFCVAFKEKISEEEFLKCLNNIHNEIRQVKLEKFPDIILTLSIGGYYGEGITCELFKFADDLLYEAKKTRDSVITSVDR